MKQLRTKAKTTARLSRLAALGLLPVLALQFGRAADPVLVGHWPKLPSRLAHAVAVSGKFAYVAEEYDASHFGLEVLDIADPANPVSIGTCDISGWASDMAISGHHAYVSLSLDAGPGVLRGGLDVIDVIDPANPLLVGHYAPSNLSVSAVAVSGNYAFMTGGTNGLEVIDVSNPAHPVRVGGHNTGRSIRDVALSGHYAYVTADTGAPLDTGNLLILDITTPTDPLPVGQYTLTNRWCRTRDVAVFGNYAYLLDDTPSLHIIDVSDPATPRRVGGTNGFAGRLAVAGDYACLLDSSPWAEVGLHVIDVSNPAQPVCVGTAAGGHGLAVSGNHAYLARWSALEVVNLSNPTNPASVGKYQTAWSPSDVAISGNYAYIAHAAADLHVIDVSNRGKPAPVGRCEFAGADPDCVAVSGGYAYVGTFGRERASLEVLDVRDSAHPVRIGGCTIGSGYFNGLALSGHYAYAANAGDGLQVINLTDPAAPVVAGNYRTGWANDVAVGGRYAYVATSGSGLEIIDVSHPATPVRAGGYDTNGSALSVAVTGRFAFLAKGAAGLEIIDVSNPAKPIRVSDYPAHISWGVTVSDNRIFMIADGGLLVLDVSDPANPVRLGGPVATGEVGGVAVSGNYAYVADDHWKLAAFQFTGFSPALSISQNARAVSLQLHGEAGKQYVIEYASAFPAGNWTSLPLVTLANSPQSIVDTAASNAGQRFYRARLAP